MTLAHDGMILVVSSDRHCGWVVVGSGPPQTESHETIVVSHVDGNHYIRVALREGFPLPLTHPLWITYRSDVASGWEDKF
nr:hypothetical protein [Tanacetum cinerariifolium]